MLPTTTTDELIFTDSPLIDSSSTSNNKTPSSSSSSSSPITESPQTSNSDISSIRSDSKTSSPSKSPSKAKTRKKYVKRACVNCKQSHAACDSERPCKRCVSLGMGDKCVDAVRKKSKNDSEEKKKKQKTNDDSQPTNPQFPFYNPMENNLMQPNTLIGNQMLMIPMLTTTVPTMQTPMNAPSTSSSSSANSMKQTQSNVMMIPFQPFFPMNHGFKNHDPSSMLHINYPPTIPPPILSKPSNSTPPGLQSSFSAFSNEGKNNSTNQSSSSTTQNGTISTSIISSGSAHSPFLPPSSPLDFLSETHSPVITNFPEYPSHPSPSSNNLTNTNNNPTTNNDTASSSKDAQEDVVDIITQDASLLKSQIEKKIQDVELADQLELFSSTNEITNVNDLAENPSEFMRNNSGNATLEDLVVLMWKKQVAQTQEIKDLKQLVTELKTIIIRQARKDNNNSTQ